MTFWKNLNTGAVIACVGLALFLISEVLMFTGNSFLWGTMFDLPVIAWMMAAGLLICLIGVLVLIAELTPRNRWLNVLGVVGILSCMGVAVFFGGFPLVEMTFGGTGATVFGLLGFDPEPDAVPMIALAIFLCSAYMAIPFVRMCAGTTAWQR